MGICQVWHIQFKQRRICSIIIKAVLAIPAHYALLKLSQSLYSHRQFQCHIEIKVTNQLNTVHPCSTGLYKFANNSYFIYPFILFEYQSALLYKNYVPIENVKKTKIVTHLSRHLNSFLYMAPKGFFQSLDINLFGRLVILDFNFVYLYCLEVGCKGKAKNVSISSNSDSTHKLFSRL